MPITKNEVILAIAVTIILVACLIVLMNNFPTDKQKRKWDEKTKH